MSPSCLWDYGVCWLVTRVVPVWVVTRWAAGRVTAAIIHSSTFEESNLNFTMTPLCFPGSRAIPEEITKLVWNNTKENHTAGWLGWILKVRACKWGRRLAGLSCLEKLFIVNSNRAACPAPIDSLWFLREQYIKNLSVDFSNLPRCCRIIHHSEHQVCINLVALSLRGNAV